MLKLDQKLGSIKLTVSCHSFFLLLVPSSLPATCAQVPLVDGLPGVEMKSVFGAGWVLHVTAKLSPGWSLAALLSTARVRGLLWDSGKKESRAGSIPTLCFLQGLCVVNVCSCL